MTKKDAKAILQGVAAHLIEGNEISYSDKVMLALDVAIEALGAQKMKYTFGNDGFSLENAYHDCKMVFDGITDDRSYQESDTGLILYYANEIIYALHKALKEAKNQNEELNNSNDLISRAVAIDAFKPYADYESNRTNADWVRRIEVVLHDMPSAQPEPSQVARDIATIIENEQDMRVIERNDIVRCKDCKHNPKDEWFGCPMSHLNEKQRPETAWCWKGERRTDECVD